MVTVLKAGKSQEELNKNNLEVSKIVSSAIQEIEERGDAAVREFSEKFDKWSPESFRLSKEQIEAIVEKVPTQAIEDIKFAQKNIREFAEAQLASLNDVEVENIAGVILGP